MKRYTQEQLSWLKEQAALKKYQTATGRLKVRKIRAAYEARFGELRSKQSIGHAARNGKYVESKEIPAIKTSVKRAGRTYKIRIWGEITSVRKKGE